MSLKFRKMAKMAKLSLFSVIPDKAKLVKKKEEEEDENNDHDGRSVDATSF